MCRMGLVYFLRKPKSETLEDYVRVVLHAIVKGRYLGTDSLGIVTSDLNKISYYKRPVDPAICLRENFEDIYSVLTYYGENTKLIMFHERLASKGTIDLENTQPIIRNSVILAHNGHLHTYGNGNKSDTVEFTETLEKLKIDSAKKFIENTDILDIRGTANFIIFFRKAKEILAIKDKDLISFYDPKNRVITVFSEKRMLVDPRKALYTNITKVKRYFGVFKLEHSEKIELLPEKTESTVDTKELAVWNMAYGDYLMIRKNKVKTGYIKNYTYKGYYDYYGYTTGYSKYYP